MWGKKDKIWMHYLHDIIAADLGSGVFLAQFLRNIRRNRSHAQALEILDLQHYKIIRKASRVQASLRDACGASFVFVIGKN